MNVCLKCELESASLRSNPLVDIYSKPIKKLHSVSFLFLSKGISNQPFLFRFFSFLIISALQDNISDLIHPYACVYVFLYGRKCMFVYLLHSVKNT